MSAIVIGAGLGGLSAAINLAAAGRSVDLFEAHDKPGGKAGSVIIDGVEVDTGPSVLTMPDVLDKILAKAGRKLSDVLTLRAPSPAFRYRYTDDTVIDVFHSLEETADNIGAALGSDARAELMAFITYAERIWSAAAPHFVYGPAPTWLNTIALGLQVHRLVRVDPLRTMQQSINKRISSPHLRKLLLRYATYNGSDPRRAPATLNCIAHVELSLGGFGVQGGITAMVDAMVDAARSLGVRVHLSSPVEKVLVEKRVRGVVVGGEVHEADSVIVGADAALLAKRLLPPGSPHGIRLDQSPSMSGWTGIYRAKRSERVPHTVLFCSDYDAEFADIFDRDRPPEDPTVYLCAQEPCHGRTGWADEEPVFVMANAPPEPVGGRSADPWPALEARVDQRLQSAGLMTETDTMVWRRTPAQLAAHFPGSQGSIYGAASNDMLAAFRRPPNRIAKIPGLYLASGSAHPGGGMPLAMLSGQAAAAAVESDRR
ncbi:MAG: phytoene desaturase family protein [Myxococcota bacterium]|nr:phytoene desaturase family protein [Myxococcota bacterium]